MNTPGPTPKPMPKYLPMLLLFLAVEVVVVSLGLVGCKERVNPYSDTRQRQSLIFFNYSVRAPEHRQVTPKQLQKLDDRFNGETIHLLTFAHYIPPAVTEQFLEETGAKVIVDSYDNTTEMHEKIRGGEKTDLILTASFMMEQLRNEGLLDPLEKKNIPHISLLGLSFKEPLYDSSLTYAVPYLWATAGIAYNYDALDRLPQTWGDLFVPAEDDIPLLRNRVSLLPVPQRAYGAALIHLGFSIDTKNKDEIIAAAKFVSGQNETLRFKYGRATMIEGLSTGEILIAQAYSNEAARAQGRNRSVRFCIPEDGTWITDYCFSIPKGEDPKKKELAEAFINFLLQPTVAADVVNYSLCASTIPETQSYVRSNIRLGPSYMLPSDVDKRFKQVFVPEVEELRNRLWQELTAGMPMDN